MFVTHIFLLTSVQFWTKPIFLDPAQPWHVALFSPPANKMSWRHGPFNSFHQNTRSRYTLHLPPHQCYAKKKTGLKPRTFGGKNGWFLLEATSFLFCGCFLKQSSFHPSLVFGQYFTFIFVLEKNTWVFFLHTKALALLCFMPKDGFQVIKSTFVPYRDNFFFWTLLPSAGCFCLNRFLGWDWLFCFLYLFGVSSFFIIIIIINAKDATLQLTHGKG